MKKTLISFMQYVAGFIFFIQSMSAYAVDSVSLELGDASDVRMASVGLQWDWNKNWLPTSNAHLGGYWDLTLGQWHVEHYKNDPNRTKDIFLVGITPVFRFQRDSKTGLYAEAGIGAYLLSDLYHSKNRKLSTAFQFGDRFGLGYVFQNGLDLGIKYQHFSNGSIKQPNDGVEFVILRASYPL